MNVSLPALVRARHLKSLLATIDRLAADSQVRAGIDRAVSTAVDGACGVDWMPFELDLAITRALYTAMPATGADAFFRAHTRDSFNGPLLHGIVDAGIRLFGLNPGSWARWVPKGWSLVFRNVGEWSVSASRLGEARLALLNLPPVAVGDPDWVRSVASSLEALSDLAKRSGEVEIVAVDLAARRAEFALRWAPAPGNTP